MVFLETASSFARYSFSWLSENQDWKLYGIFAVLYFFINVFDGNTFASLFSLTAFGIVSSLLVILILVAAYVLLIYFSYKLLHHTTKLHFSDIRQFNLSTAIGMLIVSILSLLAALFSVYELKWLALLGFAFVLGIASVFAGMGGAGLALAVLAAVFGFAYTVVVVRNFLRLLPVLYVYLRGKSFSDSLKESWGLTAAKALKLFGFTLVLTVIVAVIVLLEFIPLLFAGVGDAVINLAGIPLKPVTGLAAAVFSPATLFIEMFYFVAVYAWLVGKWKEKLGVTPAVAKPKIKAVKNK